MQVEFYEESKAGLFKITPEINLTILIRAFREKLDR